IANDYAGVTTVLDGTLYLHKTTPCGWGLNDCGLNTIPGALIVGDNDATHNPVVLVNYIGQISGICDLTIYAGGLVQAAADTACYSLTLRGGHFEFVADENWYYHSLNLATNITSYSHRFGNSAILGPPGEVWFNGPATNTSTFINVVSGSLL